MALLGTVEAAVRLLVVLARLSHSGPAGGEITEIEAVFGFRHPSAPDLVHFVVAVRLSVHVDVVLGHIS